MDELLDVLKELHPEIDFEVAEDLVTDGVLTSLDIIALIAEINAAFDVEVPAEEIVPENFSSAGTIWAMVERLRDEG